MNRRFAVIGLVLVVVAALALATGAMGGLTALGSARTGETGVLEDPDGYLGIETDVGCQVAITVTNYYAVDLTAVDVVVEAGNATVVSLPPTLAPGESGTAVLAVGDRPTTLALTITADGDGRTVEAVREVGVPYDEACVAVADAVGTRTRGYWANHPDAWPVESVTLGGVPYAKADAIATMTTPPRGDESYTLFAQLLAATLNVESGANDDCVDATLQEADDWLATNPPGSDVRGSDPAWSDEGETLSTTLDAYNNGGLCAPGAD